MTGCDRLPDIQYGTVQYNDTDIGTVASYICQTGYILSDDDTIQRLCQDNGQWSGDEPICNRKLLYTDG